MGRVWGYVECLGICGEASYREKHLTLAERRKNYHFKIKYDNDDDIELVQNCWI